MQTEEYNFSDGSRVMLVKDNESEKQTLIFIKEVNGTELNWAADFSSDFERQNFGSWLSQDAN